MATKKKTKTTKRQKKTTSKENTKKLVIVESPTKIKSVSKYLGDEYEVMSSKGHIIDLPKSTLGVDVENNFEPEYTAMRGKGTVIKELKKAAKHAPVVYLATDLDREGEAISWHIVSALDGLDDNGRVTDTDKFTRVVFPEITKQAVQDAFNHPRDFDYNLIDAYQARRVLDRLVGYSLSPLLWKKIQYGLSAGRVQSVAMRLISEREKERKAFTSHNFHRIQANIQIDNEEFEAELKDINGESIEEKHKIELFAGEHNYSSTILKDKKEVDQLTKALDEIGSIDIVESKGREVRRKPSAPFTTASLQRAGQTYLGMSAKNTMRNAQKLYEEGYITYHRTDSTNLSKDFLETARTFIKDKYGEKYVPESPIEYETKQKTAQEAHEAIRPTANERFEDITKEIAVKIGEREAKVYNLIWKRALASQMTSAVFNNKTIKMETKTANDVYTFTAKGSVIVFDGYLAVLGRSSTDVILPEVAVGDTLPVSAFISSDHETSPPPRYNEASLIRDLEANGIGRPSTYAPTIDTIQNRDYVYKDNQALIPEDIGIAVNNLLVDNFPAIVDLEFTAEMENTLDDIANGEKEWHSFMRDFFPDFRKTIDEKEESISREDYKVIEELDEKCPDCGYNMQLKLGRYGKFYSCSNFPDCKFARPHLDKIGMHCPTCENGEIIVRRTRFGKKFFGCSSYPDCDWAEWKDPRRAKEDGEDETPKRTKNTTKKKSATK